MLHEIFTRFCLDLLSVHVGDCAAQRGDFKKSRTAPLNAINIVVVVTVVVVVVVVVVVMMIIMMMMIIIAALNHSVHGDETEARWSQYVCRLW